MENIYSKIHPEILLHTTFRMSDVGEVENRVDITDVKEYLQCVLMKIEKNKEFAAHTHIKKTKVFPEFQVQECFIVVLGSVLITVFDIDNTLLDTVILRAGDLAILLEGGHSLRTGKEGAVMYEIKTGPYEGQVNDKKHI